MRTKVAAKRAKADNAEKDGAYPDKVTVSGKSIYRVDRALLGEASPMGWCIVIADRGFVWVGETIRFGERVYVNNGFNIREWGTQKGLGELAIDGPKSETVLDYVPSVMVPFKSVIGVIPANRSHWDNVIPTTMPKGMEHIDPYKMANTDNMGWTIVVADRGFVWVGDCAMHGDTLYVTNSFNVREWGTQKGLGELALEGPRKETVLDPVPAVTIPYRAVIALLPSHNGVWNKAVRNRK
jgi:hypothetical protein